MAKKSTKKQIEPVTFVPVADVFTPMVEILALADINGYADASRTKKWVMTAGSKYIIDEQKAREFVAKGYAEFTGPQKKPLTQMEVDEQRGQVTTIKMGGK